MAHLLMLHGHPVGYLPPTMASEINYDNNDTVKDKIDEVNTKIDNLTDYQIVTVEKAYTIAASTTYNFNPVVDLGSDIPEGYTVIGVVGFLTNSAQVFPINVRWNNNSWAVGLRNISTGAVNNTFSMDLLCIKTRN